MIAVMSACPQKFIVNIESGLPESLGGSDHTQHTQEEQGITNGSADLPA
jgi:hypothetical protein